MMRLSSSLCTFVMCSLRSAPFDIFPSAGAERDSDSLATKAALRDSTHNISTAQYFPPTIHVSRDTTGTVQFGMNPFLGETPHHVDDWLGLSGDLDEEQTAFLNQIHEAVDPLIDKDAPHAPNSSGSLDISDELGPSGEDAEQNEFLEQIHEAVDPLINKDAPHAPNSSGSLDISDELGPSGEDAEQNEFSEQIHEAVDPLINKDAPHAPNSSGSLDISDELGPSGEDVEQNKFFQEILDVVKGLMHEPHARDSSGSLDISDWLGPGGEDDEQNAFFQEILEAVKGLMPHARDSSGSLDRRQGGLVSDLKGVVGNFTRAYQVKRERDFAARRKGLADALRGLIPSMYEEYRAWGGRKHKRLITRLRRAFNLLHLRERLEDMSEDELKDEAFDNYAKDKNCWDHLPDPRPAIIDYIIKQAALLEDDDDQIKYWRVSNYSDAAMHKLKNVDDALHRTVGRLGAPGHVENALEAAWKYHDVAHELRKGYKGYTKQMIPAIRDYAQWLTQEQADDIEDILSEGGTWLVGQPSQEEVAAWENIQHKYGSKSDAVRQRTKIQEIEAELRQIAMLLKTAVDNEDYDFAAELKVMKRSREQTLARLRS